MRDRGGSTRSRLGPALRPALTALAALALLGATACSSGAGGNLAADQTTASTVAPSSADPGASGTTQAPPSIVPGLPAADPAAGTTPTSGSATTSPAADGSTATSSGTGANAGTATTGGSPATGNSTGTGGATTGGATGPAGNPAGGAAVPVEARAVDTSRPTRVIGTGTPASCTSAAVVEAVAAGGIITFDCGPNPVTITMAATAKVVNANGPDIVLDGGNKVTLSGGGQRRILYMNTCDQAQGWTTAHCNDQETPRLTVQNLTFADGNATGQAADGGGGGAIFVRGGQFKVVNATFVRNRCDTTGPDLGGAALRVLDQYHGLPVHVANSTFGGAPGQGGVCSNGGAISSIGVSWVVLNSVFTHNTAVGRGANPAKAGTPGGGSGGAIYLDGNRFTLQLSGTRIEDNHANEGGGAVFFVSNDRTGTMRLDGSTLRRNPSDGFETAGFPGIFFLGQSPPQVASSTLS